MSDVVLESKKAYSVLCDLLDKFNCKVDEGTKAEEIGGLVEEEIDRLLEKVNKLENKEGWSAALDKSNPTCKAVTEEMLGKVQKLISHGGGCVGIVISNPEFTKLNVEFSGTDVHLWYLDNGKRVRIEMDYMTGLQLAKTIVDKVEPYLIENGLMVDEVKEVLTEFVEFMGCYKEHTKLEVILNDFLTKKGR